MKTLIYILAAVTLCCCSSDSPEPADAAPRISFTGLAPTEASRAEQLHLTYDNFLVTATKTMPDAGMQLVFPGYRVEYGTEWVYEGVGTQYLKYWDLAAARYSFFAVAPTPDNSPEATAGYRDTRVSVTGAGISITGIKGNISSGSYTGSVDAPDWMVARTVRTASPLADTDSIDPACDLHAITRLSAMHDPVPLLFHPIMARVEFHVYSTPAPLILQSFKVTISDGKEIVNHGDYSSSAGWTTSVDASDHPLSFGDYTYNDGKTLSTDPAKPSLLASHVQIPQTWAADGRHFHIYIETKDGHKYEGDIVLDDTTNNGCSWDAGTRYIYTLCINTAPGEDEKILFTVDMRKWQWLPGNSTDQTQTNW